MNTRTEQNRAKRRKEGTRRANLRASRASLAAAAAAAFNATRAGCLSPQWPQEAIVFAMASRAASPRRSHGHWPPSPTQWPRAGAQSERSRANVHGVAGGAQNGRRTAFGGFGPTDNWLCAVQLISLLAHNTHNYLATIREPRHSGTVVTQQRQWPMAMEETQRRRLGGTCAAPEVHS